MSFLSLGTSDYSMRVCFYVLYYKNGYFDFLIWDSMTGFTASKSWLLIFSFLILKHS